eukprot:TRINITY_DN2761_c0_g1_i1.p1 TRINITY_DN2761_c0_g1~~TRINITY_DN2761_c0_g1_i1.p1  ORF type:complete len:167 (+),score=19.92 TRINITY_DN2761_c0_g1_i1:160-660(+)
MYDILVYQSKSRLLNDYITQIFNDIQSLIYKDRLTKCSLCVFVDGVLHESFVFETSFFSQMSKTELTYDFLANLFRSFFLRLQSTIGIMDPLPKEGVTWEFVITTDDLPDDKYTWIDPLNDLQAEKHGLLPVRSIDNDTFNIQLYIEKFTHQHNPTQHTTKSQNNP